MLFALVGFIYALFIIIRRLAGVPVMTGWSSLISIILIVGGLNMVMLGMVGEYIGRIYICLNNSPQYVIRDKIGDKEDES
jgi:undecaprenyl-phosphate 4-deoxy-4-formamido-L-arabinose transferase